jgi:hypothetical protein
MLAVSVFSRRNHRTYAAASVPNDHLRADVYGASPIPAFHGVS